MDDLLTTAEAREAVGRAKGTFSEWVRSGRVRPVRVSPCCGQMWFRRGDVEAALRSARRGRPRMT